MSKETSTYFFTLDINMQSQIHDQNIRHRHNNIRLNIINAYRNAYASTYGGNKLSRQGSVVKNISHKKFGFAVNLLNAVK